MWQLCGVGGGRRGGRGGEVGGVQERGVRRKGGEGGGGGVNMEGEAAPVSEVLLEGERCGRCECEERGRTSE